MASPWIPGVISVTKVGGRPGEVTCEGPNGRNDTQHGGSFEIVHTRQRTLKGSPGKETITRVEELSCGSPKSGFRKKKKKKKRWPSALDRTVATPRESSRPVELSRFWASGKAGAKVRG